MADILSQEEVDLLLNAVSGGELGKGPDEERGCESPRLAAYDFTRPDRLSKEQLQGLQGLFEAFARDMGIAFPPFLRTALRADLLSIDLLTYDEFLLSVARPTALAILNMAPLEGKAVLELTPPLIFPMIDRALGGQGQALQEPRELTEVEGRIVSRIVLLLLDCWRRSWDSLVEFHLSMAALESDPLLAQIADGGETVILAGYAVHIGKTTGTLKTCVPLAVLKPVLERIALSAHPAGRMAPEQAATTRETVKPAIMRATVPVDAILGHAMLPLEEIARLHLGDIVQLDSSPATPIRVEVEGVPCFHAKPGRQGEQSAVQLTGFLLG